LGRGGGGGGGAGFGGGGGGGRGGGGGGGGTGAAYFFGTTPRAGFEHTMFGNVPSQFPFFEQGISFHFPGAPKFISAQSSLPALFGSRRHQLV